jgi:GDP-4-dehydro-6-deoxy-D-mannose reductase
MDVRDGAEGLLVLARRGERGGVYNLCSGRAVTMRWILETVAPGVPWEVDPTRLRPAAVPALVGDPSRAAALGWSARRPVAGALSDLRASLS